MTTVKEMAADIGKKGRIYIRQPQGIAVDVEIVDVKLSYGQQRWLVRPLMGMGECWVESVEVIEQA